MKEKPNFKRWKKIITNYCMSIWRSRACSENKCYLTSEAYAFTWIGWQTLFSSFVCRWRFAIIFLSSPKSKDKMTSPVIQYDNGNPGVLSMKKLNKKYIIRTEKTTALLRGETRARAGVRAAQTPLNFLFMICTVNCSKNQTSSYNIYVNNKKLDLVYTAIQVQVRHQSAHSTV